MNNCIFPKVPKIYLRKSTSLHVYGLLAAPSSFSEPPIKENIMEVGYLDHKLTMLQCNGHWIW